MGLICNGIYLREGFFLSIQTFDLNFLFIYPLGHVVNSLLLLILVTNLFFHFTSIRTALAFLSETWVDSLISKCLIAELLCYKT